MRTEMKYFSQMISDEKTAEIISKGKNLVLTGGTGTGKTSYILNHVCKYADKVLYYAPRSALIDSIKAKAKKDNICNISVKSNQSFDNAVANQRHDVDMVVDYSWSDIVNNYNVVVFDEVHLIFADASFNHTTDYTFELLKALLESDITVIMITATGKCIFEELENKGLITKDDFYYIRTDYSYLTAIPLRPTKYCISDKIKELIETTLPDEKILYFSKSLTRAFELKTELKQKYDIDALVAYSDKRKRNRFLNNQENGIKKVKDGTFPGKLLICTKALDVGIDLNDTRIKYILTDFYDIDTLIQCIGRRRVQQGERIRLYFKNWKGKSLNSAIQNAKTELNEIDFFKTDYKKFMIEHERKNKPQTEYIYFHAQDEQWNYNKVGEIILKYNLEEYELIRKNSLAECIKARCYNINMIDEVDAEYEKNTDTRFKLFELVNRKMYMKDRSLLIDAVALVEDKAKCRHKSKDYNTLKAHILSQYQLDLISEKDKKRKVYWILEETDKTFDYARDNEPSERKKWEPVFLANLSEN